MRLSKQHPRYKSLLLRDKLTRGARIGITSLQGLIAHGRGEAFDYLLGEKTHSFAKEAIAAAATILITAKYPVISVNGNTASLVPKELIRLAKLLHASLEVNLFHASKKREHLIQKWLLKYGASKVLIPNSGTSIRSIHSNRKYVNQNGILSADVVFVPLEDGDRTEKLIALGKKVITIDLNPLSRTAQKSTVTIIDNIVRALPLLIKTIEVFKKKDQQVLETELSLYRNQQSLKEALKFIRTTRFK